MTCGTTSPPCQKGCLPSPTLMTMTRYFWTLVMMMLVMYRVSAVAVPVERRQPGWVLCGGHGHGCVMLMMGVVFGNYYLRDR